MTKKYGIVEELEVTSSGTNSKITTISVVDEDDIEEILNSGEFQEKPIVYELKELGVYKKIEVVQRQVFSLEKSNTDSLQFDICSEETEENDDV